MYELEALRVIYNDVKTTDSNILYAFSNEYNGVRYGLIDNTGKIIIPDIIDCRSIHMLCKKKTIIVSFLHIDTNDFYIYRLDIDELYNIKSKVIYRSKNYTLTRFTKKAIILAGKEGYKALDFNGKCYSDKEYLKIVEYVNYNILFGVNYLYTSTNGVVHSVDILSETGRIKYKDIIEFNNENIKKYYMPMQILYAREWNKVEVKKVKDENRLFINGSMNHFYMHSDWMKNYEN